MKLRIGQNEVHVTWTVVLILLSVIGLAGMSFGLGYARGFSNAENSCSGMLMDCDGKLTRVDVVNLSLIDGNSHWDVQSVLSKA